MLSNSLQFLLKILHDNIKINDNNVPVIKRSYPLDKTPCITIEDSGGYTVLNKHHKQVQVQLPETHPSYKPNTLLPQEYLVSQINTSPSIHIWCNNETERQSIHDQIRQLLLYIETDNYRFCNQLQTNNICTSLNKTCEALTLTNRKSIKGKCPNPISNKYKSQYSVYNINSFTTEPPYTLDENNKNPRILHSIIKTNLIYKDYQLIGGIISTNIHKGDNL